MNILNYNLNYNSLTAALVAAICFEEEFLEAKNIGDLRSPIKIQFKSNSSLRAAAKRKLIVIKSCYARLKDDERAAILAAQIVNRESGWQNSVNRRDTQLKFSFIKENKDGTYSVFIKAYPIREEVVKIVGYVKLTDNSRHELAGALAPALFKTATYLPSKLRHPHKDVPFININIGNLEL